MKKKMSKKTENEKIAEAYKCGFESAIKCLIGAQRALEPLATQLVINYINERAQNEDETTPNA